MTTIKETMSKTKTTEMRSKSRKHSLLIVSRVVYPLLGFFSDKSFDELPICNQTKKAIKEKMKFGKMTHIQAKAIAFLLKGKDLLGAAKTGSGRMQFTEARL